MDENYDIIK